MSEWHRDNPELMGTWADPWMQHESYRKALGGAPDVTHDRDLVEEDDEPAA